MGWGYRETVLVLCTIAFFVTMAARLVISPVVPLITEDFDISYSVIGIALSGMWMAYSFSQFPSGVLGDRYGERLVILVAIGGTAIASIVLALAPYYFVFVTATIVMGGLAGLHYTVATTLLTRTYDELGAAIGVHNIGAPAAGLVIPPVAAMVGVRFGWRPAITLVAAISIPVFALFAWRVRPTEPRRPDEPMRDQFKLEFVIELLSRPQIAFPSALAILGAFVWQGTASFLPAFLVAHRGQSTALAGVVFACYFVVQALTQVGVGRVSDRYGRDFALVACMGLAILGLVLLIGVSGWLALGLAVVLLGTGLGFHPALLPRFIDVLSEGEQGAGFGLVRSVYGVIGALGPVLTGAMADLFGWGVSFGVLAVMLGIVLAALLVNWALSLGY